MTQPTTTPATLPGAKWLEFGALAVVVLACSQLGYVGHPRYGPFIAAADVLCAALVVVWGFLSWRAGRCAGLVRPPAAVWAWLAVGALSISNSALDAEGALSRDGLKAGVIEVAQLALYFAFAYMLFVDLFGTVAKLRRVCDVLLVAVSVVVLWGLVDYIVLFHDDHFLVKSAFGNRNVYSAFLVMILPLLFAVAIWEREPRRLVWTAAVVVGGAITMLGPPHVWILLALLASLAANRGHRTGRYSLIGLAALAVVVGGLLPPNRDANLREFLDPFERGELYKLGNAAAPTPSAGAASPEEPVLIVKKRWLEWQPALAMLSENIAMGVGAGSYQRRIGETEYYGALPNVKKAEPDTNNLYLVTAASMGFAGLICLVAYLVQFQRRARALWQRATTGTQRGLAAGLPAAVLGLMAANIFTSLFVRGCSLIWVLLFAMVTVMTREGIAASPRDQ